MASPVYIVGLELNSGSFTDITNDVRQISYGRRAGNIFGGLAAGTAQIVLANTNKDFSPDVTSGLNAGKLGLNIGLRIQATHSGSTYNLFKGFVDEYSSNPSLDNERQLTISARDQVKFLTDRTISTSMFIDTQFDTIINEVLTAAGINSFNVDSLVDKPPFVWFDKIQATEAIQQIMNAGFFHTYIDGEGVYNFKNRMFTTTPDSVSVITRSNQFFGMEWSVTDIDVINKVKVSGTPRVLLTTVNTIAVLSEVLEIAAGASKGFELNFTDPENNEAAPASEIVTVASGDFTTNTASDGTGSNQNSATSVSVSFFGESAVSTITNNAGFTIFLTGFNIRGKAAQRQPEISFETIGSSSQAIYGLRSFTLDSPFIGNQDYAQAYSEFLIDRNEEPVAKVSVQLNNDFPNILARELGDSITVVEDHMGVNSIFGILAMNHNIVAGRVGWQHVAEYELVAITEPFSGSISKSRFGFTPNTVIDSGIELGMFRAVAGSEAILEPAEAVLFDGSQYINGTATNSFNSDSKLGILFAAVERLSGGDDFIFDMAGLKIQWNNFAGRRFEPEFYLKGTGGAIEARWRSRSNIVSLNSWGIILAAWDMDGTVRCFINNQSLCAISVFNGGVDIRWTSQNHIGADEPDQSGKRLHAGVNRIYLNTQETLDITDSANRDKFYDSLLRPINLGDAGELPTGTSPAYFFTGNKDDFQINLGNAGGNFANMVGGALTNHDTDPISNPPNQP